MELANPLNAMQICDNKELLLTVGIIYVPTSNK